MSDTGANGATQGPRVAAELVPAVEQRAPRTPAPLWLSLTVAALALALVAAVVFGVTWANDRWGDAAQLATAAASFRALVSGDQATFLSLVEPDVRSSVKRADLAANAKIGGSLVWAAPVFAGGELRLTVRGPGAESGVATFSADPARGDLVRMTASGGVLGEASGTIQLARTLGGWRITGYRFETTTAAWPAPAK